jgi:hypothetical protein
MILLAPIYLLEIENHCPTCSEAIPSCSLAAKISSNADNLTVETEPAKKEKLLFTSITSLDKKTVKAIRTKIPKFQIQNKKHNCQCKTGKSNVHTADTMRLHFLPIENTIAEGKWITGKIADQTWEKIEEHSLNNGIQLLDHLSK